MTTPTHAEEMLDGEEKVQAVREMFDTIAPRYDLVNRIMTFRLDVRWRRRAVESLLLQPGDTVIDLACGTGDFCHDLEKAGLIPLGFDISDGMLRAATTDAPLVHSDILELPLRSGSIDGATCGFALRNLRELPSFFAELARVVRPGGRIALLDVAEPENRVLRMGHSFYFGKIVPKIGGLLSDPAAYRYLPKSVAYLPDAPVILDMLREAGFHAPERELQTPPAAQIFTATRAG